MVRNLLVLVDLDERETADAVLACSNTVELPLPDHICATVDNCDSRDGWDRRRSQRFFNVLGLAVFDLSSKLEGGKSVQRIRYSGTGITYRVAAQRIDRVAKLLEVVGEKTLCRGVRGVNVEMLEEYRRPVGNRLCILV